MSPVDSPEPLLIAAAARGESEAQRVLFERHRDAGYQTALRITGRAEDALDVLQDAFIKAFASLERFQQDASFKTWFLRIVSNRALDLLRSRRVRIAAPLDAGEDAGGVDPPAPHSEEGEGIDRAALLARLQSAVDTLPPEQKAVFSLYATGELTYGEIAEVLGVPIGTVMSRLFHARRKLKDVLGDLDPGARQQETPG